MEIVKENATSLAWIGDAIMSLRVREHLLAKGYQKPNILQKKSSRICSAKGQASILETMMDENFFNEDENVILNRGRNATIHSKAKNADGSTYLKATALEALLGYLYLYKHEQRLEMCLDRIIELGDSL
ncbi:Mini-ribonuclease 3 [Floccifex sp.]|uniref:Mini-ribonuclease 3 n=1 Tax=Floccifex sp. TaxID=2815810 RepID=UPI002A75E7C2|nr:ribonuclease III domain-containing protein [Floccifex sp.]MDY2957549.1 ribonuclease III domain-containing protein [Floccifex sp.]